MVTQIECIMFAANNFLPWGNIKNNGDSTKKVSESLISCELDSTVITPSPEMSPAIPLIIQLPEMTPAIPLITQLPEMTPAIPSHNQLGRNELIQPGCQNLLRKDGASSSKKMRTSFIPSEKRGVPFIRPNCNDCPMPERFRQIEALKTEEERLEFAKNLISQKLEEINSDPNYKIKIVNVDRDENYIYDEKNDVILPTRGDKVYTEIKNLNKYNKKKEEWEVIPHRDNFIKALNICLEQLNKGYSSRSRAETYRTTYWEKLSDKVSLFLEIPKLMLGFSPKPGKGMVWGPLRLTCNGFEINCLADNTFIPANCFICENFSLTSDVKFILIVEDESTKTEAVRIFERDKNCIILTGSGYPDFATRRFAKRLSKEFPHIPMVCLTDCNPHGYHIYLLYKYNCKTSIHRGEDLSNPRLKRIGLSLKDKNFISEAIANEGIPPDKTFKTLNTEDLKCLKTLKNYKCNQGPHAEEMQRELNRFAKYNQKCDIQIVKNSLETYLRWKLEDFLK